MVKSTAQNKIIDRDPAERVPPPASGFNIPVLISNTLCNFLGEPYGSEVPRNKVTKQLCQYIKDYDLQDPSNRRMIIPNNALKKILNYPPDMDEGSPFAFFQLQKLIKHHFITPNKLGEQLEYVHIGATTNDDDLGWLR